jgi:DNA-directed RNA polymerase specialized sigma24 family protein
VIGGLPEDEREVFGQVRLQGLTQAVAAQSPGGSAVTVKRRLNPGLLPLSEQRTGLHRGAQPPGSIQVQSDRT